jgi:hypothetical protein
MEVADGQDFGSGTQIAAQFGPDLCPTKKVLRKKRKWIFAHLLVLVAQMAFHYVGTLTHLVFVAPGGLGDVHFVSRLSMNPQFSNSEVWRSIGKFP